MNNEQRSCHINFITSICEYRYNTLLIIIVENKHILWIFIIKCSLLYFLHKQIKISFQSRQVWIYKLIFLSIWESITSTVD